MINGRRFLTLVTAGILLAGGSGCYPRYQTLGSGTPTRPFVWERHVLERTENDLRCSGAEVVRLGDYTRILIPVDRVFKINSVELNPCGLPILYNLGKLISYGPCSKVEITVHTDNVFNEARRKQLSQEQANVIASHLWAEGVSRKRLFFHGCSDKDQVATDHTVFGSFDNRRIEVLIRC